MRLFDTRRGGAYNSGLTQSFGPWGSSEVLT